jgi:hypothetical protein
LEGLNDSPPLEEMNDMADLGEPCYEEHTQLNNGPVKRRGMHGQKLFVHLRILIFGKIRLMQNVLHCGLDAFHFFFHFRQVIINLGSGGGPWNDFFSRLYAQAVPIQYNAFLVALLQILARRLETNVGLPVEFHVVKDSAIGRCQYLSCRFEMVSDGSFVHISGKDAVERLDRNVQIRGVGVGIMTEQGNVWLCINKTERSIRKMQELVGDRNSCFSRKYEGVEEF